MLPTVPPPPPADDALARRGAAPPSLPATSGSLLSDVLFVTTAARRRWPTVLAGLLLGAALAYAFAARREPVYESRAAVLVQKAPTAPGQDLVADALTPRRPPSSLQNEVDLLQRSVPLALRVLAQVEPRGLAAEAAEEAGVGVDELPEYAAADYFLREWVSFGAAGVDSDIIEITASAPSAQDAAAIAGAYAEEYARYDGEGVGDDLRDARAFLEQEASEQRGLLRSTESRLRGFLEREGVVALDAQEQSAVERTARIDAELGDARSQLRLKERELAELEEEVRRVRPSLEAGVASSAPQEIRELQNRVAALEAQAADYYAVDPGLRGNEGRNPDLRVLRDRIDQTRARIEALSERYVAETMSAGGTTVSEGGAEPVLAYASELQRDAIRRGIEIDGLRAKIASLEGREASSERELSALPRQRVGLAQLERERSVAEQRYLALASRLAETRAAEDFSRDEVAVIRPAIVPIEPAGPSTGLLLALGLVGGGLLGLVIATGREALAQKRPATRSDLRALGFTPLGALPGPGRRALPGRRTGPDGDRPFHLLASASEAVRQLRTALVHRSDRLPCVVTVSSPSAGDGKSSTAAALAGSMAQAGLRTLYVDADFRSAQPGGLSRQLAGRPGLAELLAGDGEVDWSQYEYDPPASDGGGAFAGRLSVIPSGAYDPTSDGPALSELLVQERAARFVDDARRAFDVVIVDTPPVLSVVDPLVVAALSDVLLLVVAAGRTSESELDRVRERLEDLGLSLPQTVGVVLNGVASGAPDRASSL